MSETKTKTEEATFLYLVRHGATDANLQRPYVLQGRHYDLPLSHTGRQQATAVANFLSSFSVDHVYSSRMKRAVETANSISKHHNLEVKIVEEIIEVDVGKWEGMDWDAIMDQYPEAYASFMENPAANPYLEGESYGDVHRRIQPAFLNLLKCHVGESIVVVAHNVVNRVYLAGLLGLSLSNAKDIRQTNAGVNLIRYKNGETELMTLNSIFHLDDESP